MGQEFFTGALNGGLLAVSFLDVCLSNNEALRMEKEINGLWTSTWVDGESNEY